MTLGLKNNIRNVVNFKVSSLKSGNLHFDGLLFANDIKSQLKKYRRVISHDTEEWWKVWRKYDLQFQVWHAKFGEFPPNNSKVGKFHFDELFVSKVYEVWAKKCRFIFNDTELSYKILINPDHAVSKMACTNWVNIH